MVLHNKPLTRSQSDHLVKHIRDSVIHKYLHFFPSYVKARCTPVPQISLTLIFQLYLSLSDTIFYSSSMSMYIETHLYIFSFIQNMQVVWQPELLSVKIFFPCLPSGLSGGGCCCAAVVHTCEDTENHL